MGSAIGIWMLQRAWRAGRSLPWKMAAGVAVGGAIPATLFVLHNLAVFGKPLALGYDVMHPGLYQLGFGLRGFRVLDANLNLVPNAFPFGPDDALAFLFRRLAWLNVTFVPVALLVPIMATAFAAGYRVPWRRAAAFAILPAAYFFYWYEGLRLYVELLPFLLLGTGIMLAAIGTRWRRLAVALVAMVVVSHGLVALPWPGDLGRGQRPWVGSDYGPAAPARRQAIEAADSLARLHGKVLLFSREATRYDNQIDRLYVFNGPRFDGPIVVARDLGPRNVELMRRYPDHVPYLVEDRNGQTAAVFTRLEPAR